MDNAPSNSGIKHLGLMFEEVAVHEFGSSQAAQKLWEIQKPIQVAMSAAHESLVDNLSIQELFKLYGYADKLMRLPIAYRVQLTAAKARGLEASHLTADYYGLQWPLRPSFSELNVTMDLPETQTIYVRARL